MNERIKELAEQAGCKVMDDGEWYIPSAAGLEKVVYTSGVGLEKFAELIVGECIDYMNYRTKDWDAKLRWIFNDGSGYMDVDVDSLLKKHFGVEE